MGSVIYNHPIGKDYKWYISDIYCQLGGLYITYYHLLREPGFTPLMLCSLHKKSTLWLLKASSMRHFDSSIQRLKSQPPKNPNWLGLVFFFSSLPPLLNKKKMDAWLGQIGPRFFHGGIIFNKNPSRNPMNLSSTCLMSNILSFGGCPPP